MRDSFVNQINRRQVLSSFKGFVRMVRPRTFALFFIISPLGSLVASSEILFEGIISMLFVGFVAVFGLVLNDVEDAADNRLDPIKCQRTPVAAGEISGGWLVGLRSHSSNRTSVFSSRGGSSRLLHRQPGYSIWILLSAGAPESPSGRRPTQPQGRAWNHAVPLRVLGLRQRLLNCCSSKGSPIRRSTVLGLCIRMFRESF